MTSAMPERRFPPPWSAELQPNHYVVRDANKQQLAYAYYDDRFDSYQVLPPQLVHAAFINSAPLFWRVGAHQAQGVALWQRRRRAPKRNRSEPRLEHRVFDVAKRPWAHHCYL